MVRNALGVIYLTLRSLAFQREILQLLSPQIQYTCVLIDYSKFHTQTGKQLFAYITRNIFSFCTSELYLFVQKVTVDFGSFCQRKISGTSSNRGARHGNCYGNANAATLHVHWSAPGDNKGDGIALKYDLRVSSQPITDQTWSASTKVAGVPSPHVSGTWETAEVSRLAAGTTYYFGVRTSDKFGNLSPVSNIGERHTCSGVCTVLSGNVDGSADEIVDIGDLAQLQMYLLQPYDPVDICLEEANIDGSPDGVVDASDFIALIAYLKGEGPLAPCR